MSSAWAWFLSTAGAILVVGLLVISVRFFRKLYFLCEESSDLLIEIRNLLKEGPSQGKTGSPKRTDLFADNPPTGQA